MKFFGVLVLCLTAVSGFVVPAPRVSSVVRPATASTAMRMGLKDDFQKAATGASIALLSAAPALATEGTGEVRYRRRALFLGDFRLLFQGKCGSCLVARLGS